MLNSDSQWQAALLAWLNSRIEFRAIEVADYVATNEEVADDVMDCAIDTLCGGIDAMVVGESL